MENNENEKKIVGYDPQTGVPIYEEEKPIEEPVVETSVETNNEPAPVEEHAPVEETPVQPDPVIESQPEPVVESQPEPVVVSQPVIEPVNNTVPAETPKKSKAGLVIGIILGIIALAVVGIIAVAGLFSGMLGKGGSSIVDSEKTFYGDGYTLTYKSPWFEQNSKTADGGSAQTLIYGDSEIGLLPIATTDLDQTTTVNVDTESGREQLYKALCDMWKKSSTIEPATNGFVLLKDDIYYTSVKYSNVNATGQTYFFFSKKHNAAISFSTTIPSKADRNEDTMKVLKTINITKEGKSDTDTDNDDSDIANYLDQMSAWNLYKSVRSGSLGVNKTLDGGWRMLSSSSKEYWVFKGNEFWWYKSYKDLNDNYYYGTVEVATGKEGASKVGVETSKIDDTIANSSFKLTENNFYGTVLKPTKIISNGVDKSSTNLSGGDWYMMWVLVDHGSEGIELQQLNTKTADTSYYVKIKD